MSMERIYPTNYKSRLSLIETQVAIKVAKDSFEHELSRALNLTRVSAPLFVFPSSGLNDDLNGIDRPVQFDAKFLDEELQIIHSLAKWKRMALHRYGFRIGEGLYTDMNAIRRDDVLDNTHSLYVDQWDWERMINPADRNIHFLKSTVISIVGALQRTQLLLNKKFRDTLTLIDGSVHFITTQELEDKYPTLSPKEREDKITADYGTVFLLGIGDTLKSGAPHDGRAPDYDDWSLNGDLLVWNPVLERSLELSSMGVRVDADTLDKQLAQAGADERRELEYHKMLLDGKLPCTIGGGIGQSRLCMFFLGKAHIGEVQASAWTENMIETCEEHNIFLL